ncbi:MAG: hypothetical protein ACW98D_03050 [Promethearchaeota archaeon]
MIVTLVAYILISIIFRAEFVGFYLYNETEFVLGTIIGGIIALNNRQENQSILSTGAIVGAAGGVLSSVLIGFYQMIILAIPFGLDIFIFVFYFLTRVISGIVIGLIVGALTGTFYMYKELKGESNEDETVDDLLDGLKGK